MGIIFWIILSVGFAVLEIVIPALITIWFAIASVLTIFVALLFNDIIIEFTFFLIISIILLACTRKIAKKYLQKNPTNYSSDLIGEKVKITKKNSIKEYEVRFKASIWTAISDEELYVGDEVIIKNFIGNKILVTKGGQKC